MARLPCPDELWPVFSRLLDEALELPADRRSAFVAALGSQYEEVKPWLSSVIAASRTVEASAFLHSPGLASCEDTEFREGETVGTYRLERRLGGGGMGEVWLASRIDGTLTRRVALKLPHRDLFAAVLRRRFDRERDILAALSHPHIALLFDAGVDESGHPFLAMEWVEGVSLNQHCAAGRLSLDRRLDLFLQILDAVGYAHSRLIAHRDLKPSNILVTPDHSVKLLDFGIAKLLNPSGDDAATRLTQTNIRLATPDYAAPEQLAGEPITVAVDIYALGVVLYELLTGGRPFGRHQPNRRDHAPPRASAHIVEGFADTLDGSSTRQLRARLSGDLDAILTKALEADPLQRYRTAEAFAEDLRACRDHRPITARRIGFAVVAAKFVRRHWLGVAMSAGLIVLLVGGSAGIAWQALRVEREAERTTTIKNFLIEVFRASDPRIPEGKPRGEITARELLDMSAERIDSSFGREPATRIELLGVIADIYRELDETKRSTELYRREASLARAHYGPNEAHRIDGLLGEAWNANMDADYDHALALLAEVDSAIHSAGLDDSVIRARWHMVRGEALANDAGKLPEARAALMQAAALFARVAPADPLYPDALIDLGAMALESSQFPASAGYYRRAIAAAQSNQQAGGDLLLADAGLALALTDQGDYAGAGRAFAEGTTTAERTYGRDSRSYWAIASDWAAYRYDRGERDAALGAFAELSATLPVARGAFRSASDALEAAQVLRKYGRSLATDGQAAAALALLQRAQSLADPSSMHTIDAGRLQFDLAGAYDAAGDVAAARTAYLDVLGKLPAAPARSQPAAIVHERFGRFLLDRGDLDGAGAEFSATLRAAPAERSEAALMAQAGLARIALRRGDREAAERASGVALRGLDRIDGFYNVRLHPYIWGVRARALQHQGDRVGALALARRAEAADRTYYSPQSAERRDAEALVQDLTGDTARR